MKDDAAGEHCAVREGAGILDLSHRSRLRIRGGDRVTFLQRLVSNDVAALSPGEGVYAALLFPKGKLLSDLTIYHRGDHFLVDYPPETREEVFKKLTMYVLSADVVVEDATDSLALLAVHGPRAIGLLTDLADAPLPAGLLGSASIRVAGVSAVACRVDYLGEEGIDLHLAAEAADGVRAAIVDAGARPVGWAAAESLRVEAGVARFGTELDENLLPPEVPAFVTRAISYTKGCFVGQETIARIKTYGHVNRELRGLAIRADRAPEPGTEVHDEGEKVGKVTSSATPPTLAFPIALAFLKRGHFDPGTKVTVGGAEATVVPAGGPWQDA